MLSLLILSNRNLGQVHGFFDDQEAYYNRIQRLDPSFDIVLKPLLPKKLPVFPSKRVMFKHDPSPSIFLCNGPFAQAPLGYVPHYVLESQLSNFGEIAVDSTKFYPPQDRYFFNFKLDSVSEMKPKSTFTLMDWSPGHLNFMYADTLTEKGPGGVLVKCSLKPQISQSKYVNLQEFPKYSQGTYKDTIGVKKTLRAAVPPKRYLNLVRRGTPTKADPSFEVGVKGTLMPGTPVPYYFNTELYSGVQELISKDLVGIIKTIRPAVPSKRYLNLFRRGTPTKADPSFEVGVKGTLRPGTPVPYYFNTELYSGFQELISKDLVGIIKTIRPTVPPQRYLNSDDLPNAGFKCLGVKRTMGAGRDLSQYVNLNPEFEALEIMPGYDFGYGDSVGQVPIAYPIF